MVIKGRNSDKEVMPLKLNRKPTSFVSSIFYEGEEKQ
jgi:hypothetical protein